MSLDTRLFYEVYNLAHRSMALDRIGAFLADYQAWIFVAVLGLYFLYSRKVFWTAFWAAVLSRGVLTTLVRQLYHRPRPFVALPDIHILVAQDPAEAGFPSGHAAFLFAIAFAVWLYDKTFGSILIAVALLMTVARVYVGIHFPGDIGGGIVVALISVYLVRKAQNRKINGK